MHRIEGLIAGIRGAEGGTVSAVIRGTSTPATYYSDFEGTSSAVATGVALDQYGGKVMFFDRPVTITAYSSGGSIVRTWTAGDDAGAVELKSQSFKGAPYSGGGSVAGGPTTVEAAMDKWFDSAGTTDFQVMLNGVATNLDVAFSGVAGLRYYVVTDEAYGATGDGVTNDLTAIQTAINAANSAGGGVVFFPPGTYRISGTLTTYATVAFLGYHRDLSIIKVVSASSTLLSGPYPRSIKSLTFTFVAAPYTGTLMNFSAGASRCEVSDIAIGSSVTDTPVSGTVIAATAAVRLDVLNSQLYLTEDGIAVDGYHPSVFVRVSGCEGSSFGFGGASGTMFSASNLRASNNLLFVSATTGTKTVFYADSLYAHDNDIVAADSGVTVYDTPQYIVESGTLVTPPAVLYGTGISTAAEATMYAMRLSSRSSIMPYEISGNTDPVVIPAIQSSTVVVRTTSSAGWTGNCQVAINQAPSGSQLVLSVWNDTAGALTYEWSTNVSIAGGTTFAVAANSFRTFLLTSYYPPVGGIGGLSWYMVSATGGAEVAE